MTKGDEFIFSKIIRKLEDYENNNPPSENEISYTFNDVKFTSSTFDKFIFNQNLFLYLEIFLIIIIFIINMIITYKSDFYSEMEVTFNESNKKDIEYYKNYFCSNYNQHKYEQIENFSFVYKKIIIIIMIWMVI